jgi:hypothetical protein
MATKIQLTIDCADPALLATFWADALRYEIEKPPDGSATWLDYWLARGIPAAELVGAEVNGSIVDPAGVGPRVWFRPVPEPKVVKNRVHLDLDASGGRGVPLATRRERVRAEADRLVRAGATELRELALEGADHYAIVLSDPEGNEFCVH